MQVLNNVTPLILEYGIHQLFIAERCFLPFLGTSLFSICFFEKSTWLSCALLNQPSYADQIKGFKKLIFWISLKNRTQYG